MTKEAIPPQRPPKKLRHDAGIEAQPGEPQVFHRGLLLVAMQDTPELGRRAAARAVARSEGALRGWAKTWSWEIRMSREGPALQARACQLYRELYEHEQGKREVSLIEANMSVPYDRLGIMPPTPSHPKNTMTPTPVGPLLAQQVQETMAEQRHDAQQPAKQPVNERDERAKVVLHKLNQHATIIEALLVRFAKRISENPDAVQVQLKDLPKLMQTWRETQESLGVLQPVTVTPGAIEPSVRVRHAERSGTSVIEARLQDAREAVAILEALRTAELVAEERAQLAAGNGSSLRLLENTEQDAQIAADGSVAGGVVSYEGEPEE